MLENRNPLNGSNDGIVTLNWLSYKYADVVVCEYYKTHL